jgi:carboxymethylenebutenolidase
MQNPAVQAGWVTLDAGSAGAAAVAGSAELHPLRCWWARPAAAPPRAAVLVLPEVFGVNGWVRSVADRLAAEGYGTLAMPIFARTAPEFEAGYDEAGLLAGRDHRDAVTADGLLADARRAIAWLQAQPGLADRPVGCVGFCFGGHLALLAATLPQVAATCDFYGARVSSFRPGGGAPTLALLPRIAGDLLCLSGDQDPLMPPEELAAIDAALAAQQCVGRQRRQIVVPGAGHGFMCEARADFHPAAAAQGWEAMLALFRGALPDTSQPA